MRERERGCECLLVKVSELTTKHFEIKKQRERKKIENRKFDDGTERR